MTSAKTPGESPAAAHRDLTPLHLSTARVSSNPKLPPSTPSSSARSPSSDGSSLSPTNMNLNPSPMTRMSPSTSGLSDGRVIPFETSHRHRDVYTDAERPRQDISHMTGRPPVSGLRGDGTPMYTSMNRSGSDIPDGRTLSFQTFHQNVYADGERPAHTFYTTAGPQSAVGGRVGSGVSELERWQRSGLFCTGFGGYRERNGWGKGGKV